MKIFDNIKEQAFLYAIQYVNDEDYETALTAIAIEYLCSGQQQEKTVILRQQLMRFERKRNGTIIKEHLNLFLQYITIYSEVYGELPSNVQGFIDMYHSVLSDEEINPAYMLPYLYLSRLKGESSESKPVDASSLSFDFSDLKMSGVNQLLIQIQVLSKFGTRELTNVSPKLISVLEVLLIEACRKYNIPQVSAVLRGLSSLNAPKSIAIESALKFLELNQSTSGFIGYYEKDFEEIAKVRPVNKTGIRLSSTLVAISAIVDYEYDVRLYQPKKIKDKNVALI
jgi:hypothetical protein